MHAGGRFLFFSFPVEEEKKLVRSDAKADLTLFANNPSVLGTGSERGVDKAINSAAASRESTV
jgi:hypothetical protein